MVPTKGLEPPTYALRVRCTTGCATSAYLLLKYSSTFLIQHQSHTLKAFKLAGIIYTKLYKFFVTFSFMNMKLKVLTPMLIYKYIIAILNFMLAYNLFSKENPAYFDWTFISKPKPISLL